MSRLRTTVLTLTLTLSGGAGAQAQSLQEIDAALGSGDFDGAQALFDQRVSSGPVTADDFRDYARLLVRNERSVQAINVLRDGLERFPDEARFHFLIAFIHRRANRFAEAIAEYNEFLRAEPTDPDGLFGLAEALRGAGRNDEALESYRAYLSHETRSDKDEQRGAAESAIRELSGAPSTPGAPPAGGSTQPAPSDAGSPFRALDGSTVEVPPRVTPDTTDGVVQPGSVGPVVPVGAGAEAAIGIGDAAMAEASWDEAVSAYASATIGDSGSLEAWYKLGVARAIAGDFDGCAQAFVRVRDLHPDFPGIGALIARAEERHESELRSIIDSSGLREDGAVREQVLGGAVDSGNWMLGVRVQLAGPTGGTAISLARAALMEGRAEEAIRFALAAVGEAPWDPEPVAILCDAYRLSGTPDAARYWLALYAELGGDPVQLAAMSEAIERQAPR